MSDPLEIIRREVESRYHHTFVLTRNVRDSVRDGNESIGYASHVCRQMSRNVGSQKGSVVRYSISQGLLLYCNGILIADNADPWLQSVREMTGLHDAFVCRERKPEDLGSMLREAADVLPQLLPYLRDRNSANCVVIDSAEYLLAAGEGHLSFRDRAVLELLLAWSRDNQIRAAGGAVVLLCAQAGAVPRDLVVGDGGFRVLHVEYPTVDERRQIVLNAGAPSERAAVLANLTTGFRRIDVQETVERRFSDDEVRARKAEVIAARCGDSLEFIDSPFGLDMANAQPHVRRYLQGLTSIILRDRKSPLIPNGLLFVGVPGNGKSHITRAFSHDCGMNMLRFKNVRNQYVGQSERNLETILDLLPSLAPSVVFIDEVDQMIASRSAGRDADGGVEARLLGRLLEFMGDSAHRGDILWIGATNRPDLLDSAMLRRFDRIFPFMNPTEEARANLVVDLFSRLKIPYKSGFDKTEASKVLGDLSCDEVEKVVRRSYEICLNRGDGAVTLEHLRQARKVYKSNHDPRLYEMIALLSVRATNFRSDLPWFTADGDPEPGSDMPSYLKRFVRDDGTFDDRAMEQQIETLRAHSGR